MLLSPLSAVPAAPAYQGFALHLQWLLGFAAAHQLTHGAGPLPLDAPARLALLTRQAGLYAELFDADAALLPGPAAQRLATGPRGSTADLQARHGISEAELSDSGPHPEPVAVTPARAAV